MKVIILNNIKFIVNIKEIKRNEIGTKHILLLGYLYYCLPILPHELEMTYLYVLSNEKWYCAHIQKGRF